MRRGGLALNILSMQIDIILIWMLWSAHDYGRVLSVGSQIQPGPYLSDCCQSYRVHHNNDDEHVRRRLVLFTSICEINPIGWHQAPASTDMMLYYTHTKICVGDRAHIHACALAEIL